MGGIIKTNLVIILLSLVMFSCQAQQNGTAPSHDLPSEPSTPAPAPTPSPVPGPNGGDNILKHGEEVTTSGGWTVSLDTSDSVETIQLANGWSVEVLHE